MMKNHLHIGHVGLLDSAPLLVARENGYFANEGLDVTLSCELGLATVCGKLADHRIDGACLPAPLPVLLSLGAGVPRVHMQAVAICCWQGMGIVTVSQPTRGHAATVRIGVIAPGTPTRLLLHRLAQAPATALPAEVTQVPMAASQLIDFLREGMLDGFCGIDPLPALARILAGAESAADSGGLFPLHPGSVVALRADRAETGPEAAASLERALSRAREFCADPAHQHEMWRLLLSQPPYAELSAETRATLVEAAGGGRSGWTSMRFDAPSERGGLSSASEVFLENACRGAAGSGSRTFDFKAEIARVFARRPTVVSRQKVNT